MLRFLSMMDLIGRHRLRADGVGGGGISNSEPGFAGCGKRDFLQATSNRCNESCFDVNTYAGIHSTAHGTQCRQSFDVLLLRGGT